MVTITQLEYVLAVDKYKNFGKAAKSCSVSQPSLSIQIQKTEDILGYMLFDRSKKPIVTTDRGLEFIKQAKIVIEEFSRLALIGQSSSVSGKFKLGVIPTLSPYIIPLFIKKFSTTYPDVELTIIESKTEVIKNLLLNDKLDGAILVTPLKDLRFLETFLFNEPFYLYASKEMNLKGKISPSKLDPEELWLLSEGNCFRNQVINLCSSVNSGPLKNVRFEGGNLETLIDLVNRSGGCTVIPHLCMKKIKNSSSKGEVFEFASVTPAREVSFVRSRSFMKESIINSLVESIVSSLPKELQSNQKRMIAIDIN